MKRIIQMLMLFGGACCALAQSTFIVPGGLANVEGNSSASEPFSSTSFRLQMVFDASPFAIPAGGKWAY